jgi:hypothetical protein
VSTFGVGSGTVDTIPGMVDNFVRNGGHDRGIGGQAALDSRR